MACSNNSTPRECKPFLSAEEARNGSMCLNLVYPEIQAIQDAILDAIAQCQRTVTISSGTSLTDSDGINVVTVVDGGADYDPVVATAEIVHPTGVNAALTLTITNGQITAVNITNPGSGYQPVEATANATGEGNADAVLKVIVNSSGEVTHVIPLVLGTDYEVGDSIPIIHPNGTGASVEVATVSVDGGILTTIVNDGGQDYETVYATIEIEHPTGTGFAGSVTTSTGLVTGVLITNNGVSYGPLLPTLTIDSTSGEGVELEPTIVAGEITEVTVVASGSGYSITDEITVTPAAGSAGTGAEFTFTLHSTSDDVDPVYYWQVWNEVISDSGALDRLQYILDYFTCLGYTIKILTNPETGRTISWKITW